GWALPGPRPRRRGTAKRRAGGSWNREVHLNLGAEHRLRPFRLLRRFVGPALEVEGPGVGEAAVEAAVQPVPADPLLVLAVEREDGAELLAARGAHRVGADREAEAVEAGDAAQRVLDERAEDVAGELLQVLVGEAGHRRRRAGRRVLPGADGLGPALRAGHVAARAGAELVGGAAGPDQGQGLDLVQARRGLEAPVHRRKGAGALEQHLVLGASHVDERGVST